MNSISRRMLLQGAGVALSLPALEAMAPARAAGAVPKRRMVTICAGLGIHAPFLFPEQQGRDYAPTPYLDVLKDLRNDFTVMSGLSHPEVDGGHSAENSFLTAAAHPGSPSFRNTISLDQYAAERLSSDTRFPYLALSAGGSSLSWTRSGARVPADDRPSRIFARLFLDGSPDEVSAQVRRLKDGQSILDTVLGQSSRLEGEVGKRDKEKLDQYFTSVRELEQRLKKAEEWSHRPKPKVTMPPPRDVENRADLVARTRLIYDLTHLAIQTDSSRLITIALGGTNLVPPIPGVTVDWHNLSHHGRDPEKIDQLKVIELEEMKLLRDLFVKLKASTEEGETLLDRTMILFGSNLGNASSHDNRNLPILLAGGGFRHGQHLAFDASKNAPLCNVFVSMLQRLGVETNSFATSTGTLTGLSPVRA